MNCPRCGRPVQDEDYICSHCGKRIKYPETLADDLVFSTKDMPRKKNNVTKRIVIVLIAAIVICAAVLGTMLYMQMEGGKRSPQKKETTAATEATHASVNTTDSTSAKTTTVPGTTETTDEEKLYSYFRTANLYEDLLAEADGNMRLDLTAERNTAIAKYTILLSPSDDENQTYFESLESFFDELTSQLDKAVYNMKKDSGVPNAELEVIAVDQNGATLFSKIID